MVKVGDITECCRLRIVQSRQVAEYFTHVPVDTRGIGRATTGGIQLGIPEGLHLQLPGDEGESERKEQTAQVNTHSSGVHGGNGEWGNGFNCTDIFIPTSAKSHGRPRLDQETARRASP